MKKVAYVHVLPIEYYPPSSNFLDLAGGRGDLRVRAFTRANPRGLPAWSNPRVEVVRGAAQRPGGHPMRRLASALAWHLKTALALARFRPAAVISVEPHSALAVWLYYRLLRGRARLFIHHHEYYTPGDTRRPGMRLPGLGQRLERRYLYRRAEWISQTNSKRLEFARADNPGVPAGAWRVLPNYPPADWGGEARGAAPPDTPLRLVYAGSASFHDTFIREIVLWAAARPGRVELDLFGYNIDPAVREWLQESDFPNVRCDATGYRYAELPAILRGHHVGLVLYRGNTTNFVYNVPNKVFEYLRCGLRVWYPREMKGMRALRDEHPEHLHEIDFNRLEEEAPDAVPAVDRAVAGYSAERAFAPLFKALGMKTGVHAS